MGFTGDVIAVQHDADPAVLDPVKKHRQPRVAEVPNAADPDHRSPFPPGRWPGGEDWERAHSAEGREGDGEGG